MNCKYKLNLEKERKQYENGKITLHELAIKISDKIKKANFYDYYNKMYFRSPLLKGLTSRFRKVKTENQFNQLLNTLYNFGDQVGIWIEF